MVFTPGIFTSGELSDVLEGFNWREEKRLPQQLLAVIQRGSMVVNKKQDLLRSETLSWIEDDQLRTNLIKEKLIYEGTDIVALYVREEGMTVYYDPIKGERLGDELGRNDWFLKH